MRQILWRDAHRDVVARLQLVPQFAQSGAVARHQHEPVAVVGKLVRQFQPNTAGGASNENRLRSKKRIAGTHDSVITDLRPRCSERRSGVGAWLSQSGDTL